MKKKAKSGSPDALLEKLAVSSPNDAVKLLFLDEEDLSLLDDLDLSLLTEMKRSVIEVESSVPQKGDLHG